MKPSTFVYIFVLLTVLTVPLQAGTKEELVRLQNDVITLQNQFREFEKILNENNSGLKSLVEQLNDQVATSNMLLDTIAATMQKQSSEENADMKNVVPELRTLSVKIDEMTTSLSALAQQVSDLKVQSKPTQQFFPSNMSASDNTFNQALNDFIAGESDLAIQGFDAYLNYFPDGDKSTAARYYIGESHYNMGRYPEAVEAFTQIIDENADFGKVASALYKRGKSALEMQNDTMAIADFQRVMERFPEAPEASLSKAELQSLGVLRSNDPD